MGYTFKTDLADKRNYGAKRSLDEIEIIVLHFTANDGDSDEANGNYFENNYVGASAHYFVDDDSVTQSVPDDHVAFSVGGNKWNDCAKTGGGKFYGVATNQNTLSIEICDDVKNGVIYPSAKTIENAIAFTKAKMKEYNIPKERVIRHFDVNGKHCPAYWCATAEKDKKWKEEFWNKLTNEPKKETVYYRVQLGAFLKRENGENMLSKVKKAGFEAIMVKIGNYYKIQVGAFTVKKNAENQLKKLEAAGFDGFVTTQAGTIVAVDSYYPKYTGNSYGIDTVFEAIGVPSIYRGEPKNRKPVAAANGIKNYTGTAAQNKKLVTLAKEGKLKKV